MRAASLVGVITWLLLNFVSETSAAHDERKRRRRRRKLEDGDFCNAATFDPCSPGLMCGCSGRRLFGSSVRASIVIVYLFRSLDSFCAIMRLRVSILRE